MTIGIKTQLFSELYSEVPSKLVIFWHQRRGTGVVGRSTQPEKEEGQKKALPVLVFCLRVTLGMSEQSYFLDF